MGAAQCLLSDSVTSQITYLVNEDTQFCFTRTAEIYIGIAFNAPVRAQRANSLRLRNLSSSLPERLLRCSGRGICLDYPAGILIDSRTIVNQQNCRSQITPTAPLSLSLESSTLNKINVEEKSVQIHGLSPTNRF